MKILFHTTGVRVFLSALGMDDPETRAKIEVVHPTFELIASSGEPWLKIVDGSVTGTKGRWDSLRIDGEDMRQLQEYFRERWRLWSPSGPVVRKN